MSLNSRILKYGKCHFLCIARPGFLDLVTSKFDLNLTIVQLLSVSYRLKIRIYIIYFMFWNINFTQILKQVFSTRGKLSPGGGDFRVSRQTFTFIFAYYLQNFAFWIKIPCHSIGLFIYWSMHHFIYLMISFMN